jgi:hypothetical protein
MMLMPWFGSPLLYLVLSRRLGGAFAFGGGVKG